MGLKRFSDFITEKENYTKKGKVNNQIEDETIKLSPKVDMNVKEDKPVVHPNDKLEKVFKKPEQKETKKSEKIKESGLENIFFNGKIAKFSKIIKPSDAYIILENNNISKDKLHFIITPQPNNSLLVVKYNEKNETRLKEFVTSLFDVYKKNSEMKSLIESIEINGNNTFILLKNIPSTDYKGQPLIKIINNDLTKLLDNLK